MGGGSGIDAFDDSATTPSFEPVTVDVSSNDQASTAWSGTISSVSFGPASGDEIPLLDGPADTHFYWFGAVNNGQGTIAGTPFTFTFTGFTFSGSSTADCCASASWSGGTVTVFNAGTAILSDSGAIFHWSLNRDYDEPSFSMGSFGFTSTILTAGGGSLDSLFEGQTSATVTGIPASGAALFFDPLTVNISASGLLQPQKGSIELNSDGTITYTTSSANAGESDSFEYQITDRAGNTDVALVTVNFVDGDDDADTLDAVDDSFYFTDGSKGGDGKFHGNVRLNDKFNGNPLLANGSTFTLKDDFTDGDLTLNEDGTFTFSPDDADFIGEVEFSYTVTRNGLSDDARVRIMIGKNDQDLVGIVVDTHATERSSGPQRDVFTIEFVRYLHPADPYGSLTVNFTIAWETEDPTHFDEAQAADLEDDADRAKLLSNHVTFATPTGDEIQAMRQSVKWTLTAANDSVVEPRPEQFKVTLDESPTEYELADAGGTKVDVLSRRYMYSEATFTIYEGTVIATRPGQSDTDPGGPDAYPVDASDFTQEIGDCYFIAALIAAVRADAVQIENLITANADGTYHVIFPGAGKSYDVSGALDRGEDMIDFSSADVNAAGSVEIWPVLIERAYALLRAERAGAPADQAYLEIGNGLADIAYFDLTGRQAAAYDYAETYATPQAALTAITNHLSGGPIYQVMISTQAAPGEPAPSDPFDGFHTGHVYVVDHVEGNNIFLIDPLLGSGSLISVPADGSILTPPVSGLFNGFCRFCLSSVWPKTGSFSSI